MTDLVIRNATVIDGTRAPRYQADIAVSDGVITAIGPSLPRGKAEIDATNRIAAPCVLNYWRSSHYGGAEVSVAAGEKWSKVIGPFQRGELDLVQLTYTRFISAVARSGSGTQLMKYGA